MQAVWLVGGLQDDADYLMQRYSGLDNKAPALLPNMPLAVQYAHAMQVCLSICMLFCIRLACSSMRNRELIYRMAPRSNLDVDFGVRTGQLKSGHQYESY